MSAHPDVIADLDRLGLDYEVMDCDPDRSEEHTSELQSLS